MKKFFGVIFSLLFMTNSAAAMTFSQPVEIGKIHYRKGFDGIWFEGDSWHKDITYYGSSGVARFGEGKNALYVYHTTYGFDLYVGGENTALINSYLNFPSNPKSIEDNLNICEKNKKIIDANKRTTDGSIYISKIDSTSGKVIYFLYHDYPPNGSGYMAVGPIENGKWAKYFGTHTYTHEPKTENVDMPSSYYFKGDTIIVEFKNNLSGKKVYEMRYKWNEKKQWFGVEKVVY